ncbi:HlyD family type I secretion periplasmic adaptor subunit [Rugamonas sp. CCM 8940]|uniref:HlyD family type I secretion periplasmic adaptor subunit n=1 Tax=Rugamonas sp. CCM 8940 TaxID=2765359 RepID=UPI0018F4E050|nr:HlyD family type I secretion periplasmic adaptor subunit [Rugamonas sp. CCM 8940]MBJ7308922.1 HlyD family type I secretion periplasmic adaptor subunit [Rugamonas sp. CCM 8940]
MNSLAFWRRPLRSRLRAAWSGVADTALPGGALTARERRFSPQVLDISEAPAAKEYRIVLWAIVGLTLAMLAWSLVGDLDVVCSAPGRVVADGAAASIQTAETSIVKQIHVKEGQRVRRGDVLVELDAAQRQADVAGLAGRQGLTSLSLRRLKAELAGASSAGVVEQSRSAQENARERALMAERGAAFAAKLAAARAEILAKSRIVDVETALLAKTENSANAARLKEVQAAPYVGKVLSQFDYVRLEEAASAAASDMAAQRQRLAAAEQEVATSRQKLVEIGHDRKQQILGEIGEKSANLEALATDGAKAEDQLKRKKLSAPIDGTIQFAEANTAGLVLNAGQTIMTVVPDRAAPLIEVVLKNEDISQVKIGQRVSIKVDAFPFHRHGVIAGDIMLISPDVPERDRAIDRTPREDAEKKRNPGYRLYIRPSKNHFVVDGKVAPLLLGMSIVADVNLGKRKIYQYLTSPISESVANSLSER